jgi:retinol-binding protein 3
MLLYTNYTCTSWGLNHALSLKNLSILLYCIITITTCFGQQKRLNAFASPPKMKDHEIKTLIDSLDTALSRWYVYPGKVAQMLSKVKKNYKSGAYNLAKDQYELAALLHNDVQLGYKDGHMNIRYDPHLAELMETPMPDTLQQQEYERSLSEARENNFAFKKTEALPGNIGYIRWDGFWEFIEEAKPTLDAAFKFVSNSKALILDMRYNQGGSPGMVLQMQSYFFTEITRMNDIIDSRNDTLKRWADPTATGFKLNMPVYILTSRTTFSGAEDFTYGLQQVKRATVVGDTSGGGAHPTRGFSIGQGFVIYIPTHRSPNIITNADWEGTGVYPDIAVPSEQALTQAQVLIFTELLSKAKNEKEKYVFQWHLNSIGNKARLIKQLQGKNIKITTDTLLTYCGEYISEELGPITIILKGNQVYRHVNNGVDVCLVSISPTKFVYNDDSVRTIDFVRDKNGEISDLILSTQNGRYTMTKKK